LSRHFSEDRVASFLVSQKYRILDQNVVFPTGEIDIVALRVEHWSLLKFATERTLTLQKQLT